MTNRTKIHYTRAKKRCNLRGFGMSLLLASVLLFSLSYYIDQQKTMKIEAAPTSAPLSEHLNAGVHSAWGKEGLTVEDHYFIRQLNEAEQAICKRLYSGMMAFEEEITLIDPISKDTLSDLMWLMKFDCPELFQITDASTFFVRPSSPDMVLSIQPGYCLTREEYTRIRSELELVLESLKKKTAGMDAFTLQKTLYDHIISGAQYVEEGAHTGTIYGAMLLGKARCEGFAQAVNYIMRAFSMDSCILTGEAAAPSENGEQRTERHAWNAVQFNGSFYQMDTTWDLLDETGASAYAYYNVRDEEMARSRKLDDIYERFSVPLCRDMTYNYHRHTGSYIPSNQETKSTLFALLDDALLNGRSSVTIKTATLQQYDTLMAHHREWMQEWCQKNGYEYGNYHLKPYPDSYVVLFRGIAVSG